MSTPEPIKNEKPEIPVTEPAPATVQKDKTSETPIEWETPIIKIVSAMEIHQSRFCLIAAIYFFSLVMGLSLLLGSQPLYLLGTGLFMVLLVIWIVCPTAVFLLITLRSYKPLAEISTWLDKNLGAEE